MPPKTADEALERLREIRAESSAFCEANGAVTEADTRAKLIDKVLVEVCGWPESDLSREQHVQRGYMDYCLKVLERPFITVEAKREGVPFVFPTGSANKWLRLSGTILTRADVRDAIAAAKIRAMVVRKTKTDQRDARHLLDLIVRAASGGGGARVGVPRTAVPSTGPLYRLCSVTRARIVAGAMWRFHEATHASKPSASDASKWVESRSTCTSSGKRGTVSA